MQNPIVRKAIGQIFAEKQQYTKAIAQLKIACELQPNDTETYQQLIDCYDKQGDKAGAMEQLLQAVQLSRRDIKLYQNLGKRYESLGKGKETERAYTSIVEVLPNESESYTLLAEIRQEQNRWPEAIACWKQVAKLRSLEPRGLLKLASANPSGPIVRSRGNAAPIGNRRLACSFRRCLRTSRADATTTGRSSQAKGLVPPALVHRFLILSVVAATRETTAGYGRLQEVILENLL